MSRSLIVFLLLYAFALVAENRTVKTFEDTGKALLNPQMGWCSYFVNYPTSDFGDANNDFDGCNVVYFRIAWSKLQPSENFIDWSQIDGPAQRWIAAGKKIALRFITSMACNSYCTPKWVFDSGAKAFKYKWKGGREYLDPVFDDPVFLKKLEFFLSEAGKRYGNNPNVAFIDVGTFGLWGEGHTLFTQKLSQSETDRIAELHADLHLKYFPNTLLAISDDVIGHNAPGDNFPLLNRLRAKGITLRDDSILVNATTPWYHAGLAQKYWRTLPVILEHDHLGGILRRGTWNNERQRLLEAVEKYHASFMSIHYWADLEKKELGEYLDKINRRLGYRIQIREMNYPSVIKPGVAFLVNFKIANAGVAPCYPGGFLTLTLKNDKNDIVSTAVADHFNVRTLAVGSASDIPVREQKCRFKISKEAPDIPPGHYRLYVSLGDLTGTPVIALPHGGDDGNKRYFVGTVKIENDGLFIYHGKANRIWVLNKKACLPNVFLHRKFELKELPRLAFLQASADVGTLYVNGVKMPQPLDRRWLLKQYDLRPYLRIGENLLAVSASSSDSHGFIADLRMEFPDGKTENLLSDTSWFGSGTAVTNWESDRMVSASWSPVSIVEPARVIGTRFYWQQKSER